HLLRRQLQALVGDEQIQAARIRRAIIRIQLHNLSPWLEYGPRSQLRIESRPAGGVYTAGVGEITESPEHRQWKPHTMIIRPFRHLTTILLLTLGAALAAWATPFAVDDTPLSLQ